MCKADQDIPRTCSKRWTQVGGNTYARHYNYWYGKYSNQGYNARGLDLSGDLILLFDPTLNVVDLCSKDFCLCISLACVRDIFFLL